MPIEKVASGFAFVKFVVAPDEIPKQLALHRAKWGAPDDFEATAQSLIANDFPSEDAKKFVLQVIRWGGGHRFVDRFDKLNTGSKVAAALKKANLQVRSNSMGKAVKAVAALKYLGFSFASKVLRFMAPEKAVILDQVLSTRLGYPKTAGGYEDFLSDCYALREVAAPDLRICDIESALFAKVQGYSSE